MALEEKVITINTFINNQQIFKLNNGWISNGHWAVDPDLMPKSFRDRISKETEWPKEMPELNAQIFFDDLKNQNFMEIFPINPPEDKKEIYKEKQILLYESLNHSLQIGLYKNYVGWLLKNFPQLKIMAYDPERPVWLYKFNSKIGCLMPMRII